MSADPCNIGDGIAGRLPLLVIDDDVVQRALIAAAAERCHYSAVQAESLQSGLALLEAGSFVCVTLDLGLGDGDGVDILEAMARLHYAGSVFLISGKVAERRAAARQFGRSLGIEASYSLRKPIDLTALRIAFAKLRSKLLGLPMAQSWGQVRDTRLGGAGA